MKRVSTVIGTCLIGMLIGALPARGDVFAYGVATDENLYQIDVTTGATTLLGSTGQFMEGLALSPGGQLFGTDSSGLLYSINPLTGASTLIGDTGRGNVEGLDFNGNTLVGSDFKD